MLRLSFRAAILAAIIAAPSVALAQTIPKTKGPTRLITDLALFEPDPATKEMTVVSIHPGVTREQIAENTGWKVAFASQVAETPAPTAKELEVLRELQVRTKRAQEAA